MNNFKKLLRQSIVWLGAGLMSVHVANSYAARCEYVLQSDWNTGFVAAIRITNDTSTPVNGWSVSWAYSDGSTRTGGWNANFSGNNPYSASGVGWNDRINPGQSIEFGVQGNKKIANAPAQRPVVYGAVCATASSVPSSVPSSSSSSVITSRSSLPPSSSSSITSSSSSSSTSKHSNLPPIADLQINTHGLTVQVSGRSSIDPDGDALLYTIDFGDGQTIQYPEAWSTYQQAGEYVITITVSDGIAQSVQSRIVNVQPQEGNSAPVARLTSVRQYGSINATATSTYDKEDAPLTYEWDFGDGVFTGGSSTVVYDCKGPTDEEIRTHLITLTVSDGELKDTIQRTGGGRCNFLYDVVPHADFDYRVVGSQVFFDASKSRDEEFLRWDFGDGRFGYDLFETHTYTSPGIFNVWLRTTGQGSFTDNIVKTVTVGINSSRSASRSSASSGHSESSDRNYVYVPHTTAAPVIDGNAEETWRNASIWIPMDVFWTGTQSNPSAQDFKGRYKAMWDENYLYLLVDITDDVIYDGTRDPLTNYWQDDTVEIFIDENKNGGPHEYNTSAWAYHISTYGDVVDYTTSGPKLLNEHIDARRVTVDNRHLWEIRMRIYGEDYADGKANVPLKLFTGKIMGFSLAYIDNDGSSERESMMGSVDTDGHRKNEGYRNASVFGTFRLLP